MKKQTVRHGRKHETAYWLLLMIGIVASGYALKSLALWLPWGWAQGLASDASVWPVLQLACSGLLLAVAVGYLYLMRRRTAIVFGMIGIVTLVPMIALLVTQLGFAQQHGIALDVLEQAHVQRTHAPADQSVRYGQADGRGLDLSVYRNSNITKNSPAVLYVHGGGWGGGSRSENSEFFRWLNDRGYSVYSVDYRNASVDYATWRRAPQDLACALAWLGKNADAQRIDRDDLTIMGDSAGGQLALRVAYGLKSGDVASSCDGQPIVPAKVAAIVPAIDFRELYSDPRRGDASRANVVNYLGGTPAANPAAYDDASIATHVTAGLQPTLIINAGDDTLVSPDSGVRLATRLRAAGVDAQQYTLPYAAHSYWINPGGLQAQTSRGLIEKFLGSQ